MLAKVKNEEKNGPTKNTIPATIKIIKHHHPGLPSYALGKLADTLHCVNKPAQVSFGCGLPLKKILGDVVCETWPRALYSSFLTCK